MKRREFLHTLAAGSLFGLPLGSAHAQTTTPSRAPEGRGKDLALINAKILTLNPELPEAQAALVRGDRIAYVGTNAEVKSRARDAAVFDAGGRLVVPGFIDSHVHFELTCLFNAYQVPCHSPSHPTIASILDALRAKASTTPPGRWVIGRSSGLPFVLTDKRMPTRQEMDSVSEQHPVVLLSAIHIGAMNTRAFKETGLWDAATTEKMLWPGAKPRIGTFVHRDANGVPTGVATEMWDLIARYPVEEIKAAIRSHGFDKFVRKGITSAATMPLNDSEVRASLQLRAAGELPLRLRVYYNLPQAMTYEGLIQSGLEPGFGDDLLRFGGVKIFVTGIFNDGLGNRFEDYKWTADELTEVVSKLHDANIQVCMHVVGDNGPIERAISAVEYAQRRNPKSIRHRLEHATNLREIDHVRRMRKLDMRVTITRAQPVPRSGGGGVPFRMFIDEGLEPIAISDTTGTTPVFSPLGGIASLVAQEAGATPAQAVTFEEALKMWTLWAARGSGQEHDKGSIATGKLGDFVVLSKDPRGRPTSELLDLQVDATIIGGDVVFRR